MASSLIWTPLRFSQYEGKTLPEIVLNDPDWFFWAYNERIFREPEDDEADIIARRACKIKIPKPNPETWRVEYYILAGGKFGGFSIVRKNEPILDPSQTITSPHLDLSYPRSLKTYDKLANKTMVDCFRHHYFGRTMPTRQECENFFYCGRNFI